MGHRGSDDRGCSQRPDLDLRGARRRGTDRRARLAGTKPPCGASRTSSGRRASGPSWRRTSPSTASSPTRPTPRPRRDPVRGGAATHSAVENIALDVSGGGPGSLKSKGPPIDAPLMSCEVESPLACAAVPRWSPSVCALPAAAAGGALAEKSECREIDEGVKVEREGSVGEFSAARDPRSSH